MTDKKRDYQRSWISHKRKILRVHSTLDTFHSDPEEDDDVNSPLMTRSLGLATNVTVLENRTCQFLVSPVASGDTQSVVLPSPASNDLESWDAIDKECFKYDSSDSDDEYEKGDLASKLRTWAVDCGVTHSQLNKLLPILKEMDCSLPLSAKTLLKTPDDICSRSLSGGDYIYLGVREGLNLVLSKTNANVDQLNVLELALNIDGVPLFHASTYSLWPVLCYITNVSCCQVFVISIYGGKAKPTDLAFLDDTIEELQKLLAEGVIVGDKHLKCVLKYCVCDAVAKAMVKCIKQFSGYYGCDKCMQKGKYLGRMTYPECEAPVRTDSDFRLQTNPEHHNGTSPFCRLPVDMIRIFPIDYMHQVCLGVTKRLLVCWTSGIKRVRLSSAQKLEVSSRLLSFRQSVTSEFTRKPRPLTELSHWKATEFRLFLLYTGYFVLNKVVTNEVRDHFACLSVAIRILASDTLSVNSEYRSFAHKLLLHFVSGSAAIYGPEFMVYNVHSLVHIADEVETFGKLDNCSAFIFENFLQILKRLVRSAKNPVIQVVHRLKEETSAKNSLFSSQYVTATCELHTFSCSSPNNYCILLDDARCCQVITIDSQYVTCMVYKDSEPVYVQPCDSRITGIHKVQLSKGILKTMPRSTLACKAICYASQADDCLVFIQLLHSL